MNRLSKVWEVQGYDKYFWTKNSFGHLTYLQCGLCARVLLERAALYRRSVSEAIAGRGCWTAHTHTYRAVHSVSCLVAAVGGWWVLSCSPYHGFSLLLQYFPNVSRWCCTRGKSLLESWSTTFLPDWQLPLIFVWFTSKSHEHLAFNNEH